VPLLYQTNGRRKDRENALCRNTHTFVVCTQVGKRLCVIGMCEGYIWLFWGRVYVPSFSCWHWYRLLCDCSTITTYWVGGVHGFEHYTNKQGV